MSDSLKKGPGRVDWGSVTFMPERDAQSTADPYTGLGAAVSAVWRACSRDELYAVIAEHLPVVVPCDRCALTGMAGSPIDAEVVLFDRADADEDPSPEREPETDQDRLILDEAMQRRRRVRGRAGTPATEEDEGDQSVDPKVADRVMHQTQAVTVQDGQRHLATMMVSRENGVVFDSDEADRLAHVADLLSLGLQRLESMEAAEEATERAADDERRLNILRRISQELAGAASEREVFSAVHEAVEALVAHDHLSFAAVDVDSHTAEIIDLSRHDDVEDAHRTMPLSDTTIADVVRTGQSVYTPDLRMMSQVDAEQLVESGMRTGLSMALISDSTTLGTLNLASHEPDVYSLDDRDMLLVFARLMAAALGRVLREQAPSAGIVDAWPVDAWPVDAWPVDAGPVEVEVVDVEPGDDSPADDNPIDDAPGHDDGEWVERILAALDEDRFELFAQVIRPLADDTLLPGFEMLVRMVDDEGHFISPGQFMRVAEDHGLMNRIDNWVIRNALDWLGGPDAPPRGLCTINVSPHSLEVESFLDQVLELLDESAVDPTRLVFEIAETAAIRHLERALSFMAALKERGCLFALDDFGSGFSSFAALKQLPVDIIKIDGQLVRDIENSGVDDAAVRSVKTLATALGMLTIAESVETEDALGVLRDIGIDYAQGYHLGRPQPLVFLTNMPSLMDSGT